MFAPIDFDIKQEERVASIISNLLPDIDVVCSNEVANIGIIERENASIMNAALLRYAKKTILGFQQAAKALRLECPIFITSNDGTLMTCKQAARLPIRTLYVT